MLIKADKEGQDAIIKLCDIALKTGGIPNMAPVNSIMTSVTLIEADTQEETDKVNP